MKARILLTSIVVCFSLAAQCVPEPEQEPEPEPEAFVKETSYELVSFEVTYPQMPKEGGTIAPDVTYSYNEHVVWSDGREDDITHTDGAGITFVSHNDNLVVDEASGSARMVENLYFEPHSFFVTVELSLPDGNVTAIETEIVVVALDDYVVSTSTVQLPLELGPHQCAFPEDGDRTPEGRLTFDSYNYPEVIYTSRSKDGTPEINDEFPDNKARGIKLLVIPERESISAAGTDIPFSGGELAVLTQWASGKIDTLIVKEPVYTTETTSSLFCSEYHYVGGTGRWTVEDETKKPSSAINGKIWHIHSLGTQCYVHVRHTLKATVDDVETSILLYQNMNPSHKHWLADRWCEIWRVDAPYLSRTYKLPVINLELPEFDDYRPGGQHYGEQWPKFPGFSEDLYLSGLNTRNLHKGDNVNRAVLVYIFNSGENIGSWALEYLSGEIGYLETWYYDQIGEPVQSPSGGIQTTYQYTNSWRNNIRATMTAEASVPLKDGSTKDIHHQWEWTSKPVPELGTKFSMFIPEVKDAAADFQWKIDLDIQLDESVCRVIWKDPDYSKLHSTFYIMDCLETFEEFCASMGIPGPFADPDYTSLYVYPVTPLTHGSCEWEVTADIADGLTAEEYMNTPYDQLPGR